MLQAELAALRDLKATARRLEERNLELEEQMEAKARNEKGGGS